MLIGNGWTDPLSMYQSYGIVTYEHNLVPQENKARTLELITNCEELYKQQPRIKYGAFRLISLGIMTAK